MPEPTIRRCEFCGRVLRERDRVSFGGLSHAFYETCGCPGAVEHRRRVEQALNHDAEERARLVSEAKAAAYERAIDAAGIPERYRDARVDWFKPDLYIVGSVGSGKTWLGCALARHAVDDGMRVIWTTGVDIIGRLHSTYDGSRETEDEVVGEYSRCDLLVIDDLGKEKPTEYCKSALFRIVNARYNAVLPLIVTSQFERGELCRRWGNDETAFAIVSRLKEMTDRYEVTGPDRRLS